ncbi:MAG TPA: hypothetical protein ENJ42_01495 [Hellea balneolensis]|uniref:T2SS protein K first SAM-like domain-containing protein n=1 Tax=Hellea balneolensis TaxID=287478 RepID=A0A7C5R766_9PROT|nr:hypothetical protein [Hellea balneolensis]
MTGFGVKVGHLKHRHHQVFMMTINIWMSPNCLWLFASARLVKGLGGWRLLPTRLTPRFETGLAMTKRNTGFVLPFVLVSIAILSLATVIAMQRLSNSTQVVSNFKSKSTADLAFSSAQNQVLYAVLSAEPVEGGLHLRPPPAALDPFARKRSPDTVDAKNYWRADGGVKTFETAFGTVQVIYFDTGAFVSLNTAPAQDIVNLLRYHGLKPDAARQAAARLIDYRDADNIRLFRGAERPDYRLHKLPGPANSTLRSFEELSSVMGWGEIINKIGLYDLQQTATLNPRGYLKTRFVAPSLRAALGLNVQSSVLGGKGSRFADRNNDTYPSKRGRFILQFTGSTGIKFEKAIEIDRRINSLEKPFRVYLVYDTIVFDDNSMLDAPQAADKLAQE